MDRQDDNAVSKSMKISIVTVTWNSDSTIRGMIDSLARQTLPRDQIEWIVVDGASTDATLSTIEGHSFQPDILISEPDKGIYDALNKGIAVATGEVVGILHGDDFLSSPDVLSGVADGFKKPETEALYGDLQYVKPLGHGEYKVIRHWKSGAFDPHTLQWGWMPPHPTFYLKRKAYEEARLANGEYYDTSYSCAADYDFMLRYLLMKDAKPVYLPQVFVMMQVGGLSNRSLKHIIRKSREDWQVIRRNQIGGIHTLAWKNLQKIKQFFIR